MNPMLNDPLGILRKPMTTAANRNGVKAVTARLDNVNVGLCPVCNVQMKSSLAKDIPVYVCLEHHICLPQPN